jgi:hypothetical protein
LRLVVDPAGKGRTPTISPPAVGGGIGETFLNPADGGFDCGYEALRHQVFRCRKWNGFVFMTRI